MTPTEYTTDQVLHTSVCDELGWAPEVDAANIGVAVLDGTVTLSGEVHTYPEKRAALKASLRVRGVTAVADELVVTHAWGAVTDSHIAVAATDALRNAVSVPSTVQATVHDHVITLSGEVSWDFQRAAARRAVDVLPGVTGVWSTLTITHRSLPSPAVAERAITAALMRNAALDAAGIRVSVTGNEVTLDGSVSSASERRQAEYAAWSCPGATTVQNRITIQT